MAPVVPDYSIWTFCYARGRLPKDFMGGCPACSNQGMADIPMLYPVIASAPSAPGRRVILVDCGFKTGASMTGRKFEDFERPDAVLAKAGFRPEDVDTLVLTHLHFDHAGNFDAFPNARVLVQRREYERWKEVIDALPDRNVGKDHWALSSMDVELFDRFDAAVRAGKIELVEGDVLIAPGVHCRLAADTQRLEPDAHARAPAHAGGTRTARAHRARARHGSLRAAPQLDCGIESRRRSASCRTGAFTL